MSDPTRPAPAGARTRTAVLRSASPDDAAGILAIYAPIIRDTAISFEFDPPTEDAMRERVRSTLERWPWLVCERDGAVLGYAYGGSHRERAAYQWCVETAIYVHIRAHRSGVARALYHALFAILREQGFVNAYAGVTLPNEASVRLHEAFGFRPVGVYEKIGFKQGAWHDVGWWQRELQPRTAVPGTPRPFPALRDGEACAAALRAGTALLRA